MVLRFSSLIFAVVLPPLSSFLWRGSNPSTYINFLAWCCAIVVFFKISFAVSILIYLVVMLHALYLVVFCDVNDSFPGVFDFKSSLHISIIFIAVIVTTVIFEKQFTQKQPIFIDQHAITKGKKLFSSCQACHKLSKTNFVGPHLVDILGRQVGSLPDYKYSEGMKNQNFVWDNENLAMFLQNPSVYIPGTRMVTSPLSPEDASDISTYLQSR